MKQKLNNLWIAFLGAILSMLGISSCSWLHREEYGCPHADYKFVGEVNDGEKPIAGIRTVVFNGPMDKKYNAVDTSYTDAAGKTERELPISMLSGDMVIKFEDVDGEENGSWQTETVPRESLELVQTADKDGKWYEGAYTIKAKATLKKAE